MSGIILLVVWLVLAAAAFAATLGWSVRMWRRRGELSLPVKLSAGLAAVSAVAGSLGTLVGLVKAAGARGGESVDPSQRARMLGESIAVAMNWTAAGVSLWLLSVVALTLVTKKRKVTPN